MSTQNISHNTPSQKPYIAIPEKFSKTFDKLNVGDIIYKLFLDKGVFEQYEIVEIKEFMPGQHEFGLQAKNKKHISYTIFDDQIDESFRAFDKRTYEYKRELIGNNNNIVYFFNKEGLNDCLDDYIKPIIKHTNNIKEKFETL